MANTYQMTCNSIVEHANETHKNLKKKTDNLLALVDISYHMEQMKDDKRRKRAAASFLGRLSLELDSKQSEQILARLTIPSGKKFSPEEVQNLLELESGMIESVSKFLLNETKQNK